MLCRPSELLHTWRLQIAQETLPALLELKQSGRVRHIGITGLPLGVFETVLQQCTSAVPDVVLSYCHYCLNDNSLLDILPALEQRRVGVINASCLSMGLLTQQGPPEWHPAPEELRTAARAAADCAASHGVDIARLALMWAVKVLHQHAAIERAAPRCCTCTGRSQNTSYVLVMSA